MYVYKLYAYIKKECIHWRCSVKKVFLAKICVAVSFDRAGGLQACNFTIKRLQRSCFPVKFAKFSFWRTSANSCSCLHFLQSMVCRYAWIHNVHYAYKCVITDINQWSKVVYKLGVLGHILQTHIFINL